MKSADADTLSAAIEAIESDGFVILEYVIPEARAGKS